MAMTITIGKRGALGGSAFRCVEVTHDGSTSSLAASSIDLSYIEWFTQSWSTTSTDMTVSTTFGMNGCSIEAGNKSIGWFVDPLPKASSISRLFIVGW